MEKVCNYLSPELMLGNPSKACGDTEMCSVNSWGQAEGERAFVSPEASSGETPTPLSHKEIPISVK